VVPEKGERREKFLTKEEVRESMGGFTKKDRILLLQTKLKHIMDNGNHGQQATVARTIEEIYDEVYPKTE